jgi:hypothetical protein
MSARWVAATVRARAMARRRIGATGARELAALPFPAAVAALSGTSYGHDVRADHPLAAAQHGVAATLLWNLRVLAGWLPGDSADTIRILAGGFEAANVDEHLAAMAGRPAGPVFRLGTLGTTWNRLSQATSPAGVREVLASSPWGDPGEETTRAIVLGMQFGWAERIVARVPQAGSWALGAVALAVARELFAAGRALPAGAAASALRLLGPAALTASAPGELRARVPRRAGWALAGVDGAEDLWAAEARWWGRVESDGFALLRRPQPGPDPVAGTVAVLAVDAWRTRAALEVAARGGGAALEVFDALA